MLCADTLCIRDIPAISENFISYVGDPVSVTSVCKSMEALFKGNSNSREACALSGMLRTIAASLRIHIQESVVIQALIALLINITDHTARTPSIVLKAIISADVFSALSDVCRYCPGDTSVASCCSKFVYQCLEAKCEFDIFMELIKCIKEFEVMAVLFFCIEQEHKNCLMHSTIYRTLLFCTSMSAVVLSLHGTVGGYQQYETLLQCYNILQRSTPGWVCMALILSSRTTAKMDDCIRLFVIDVMLDSAGEEYYLDQSRSSTRMQLKNRDIALTLVGLISGADSLQLHRVACNIRKCLLQCIGDSSRNAGTVEICLLAIEFLAEKELFNINDDNLLIQDIKVLIRSSELHVSNQMIVLLACRVIRMHLFLEIKLPQETLSSLENLLHKIILNHKTRRPIILAATQVVLMMLHLGQRLQSLPIRSEVVIDLMSLTNDYIDDEILATWLSYAFGIGMTSGSRLSTIDKQRGFEIIMHALERHINSAEAASVLVLALTKILSDRKRWSVLFNFLQRRSFAPQYFCEYSHRSLIKRLVEVYQGRDDASAARLKEVIFDLEKLLYVKSGWGRCAA